MSFPPPPGLRARTLRGFLLMGAQRVLSLVVTAAGGILLARLLSPELFGVYAIIGFAVGLGVTFGDLGLGVALVQRRDLDPGATLAVAFTAHVGLAVMLGVGIILLAPAIAAWLRLTSDAVAPLRCLALLVPLAALRMPAVVLLERNLTFLPLTLADSLDTVVFHAVASVAALRGAGVWSFVLGAVAARLAGLAVLWRAIPWRPAFRWCWADLAPVLRFGVLFQGSSLITVLRDSVVPTYVAAWSGVAAVGFLNWAAAIAFLPLQMVSIAGKALFPALSRLQHNPREFAEATERALNRVATLLYPGAFILLAGADSIIRPIYGDRWVPAIPAIRLFCVTAILGGTSSFLVQALYSFGRADIVLHLNLLWTGVLWALTVLLVPRLGFVGFAVASACVAATGAFTALALRRLVPMRFFPPLRVPLAAGLAGAVVFSLLARAWIHDIPTLLGAGCLAVGVYVGLACLMGGPIWRAELLADWRRVWNPTP